MIDRLAIWTLGIIAIALLACAALPLFMGWRR